MIEFETRQFEIDMMKANAMFESALNNEIILLCSNDVALESEETVSPTFSKKVVAVINTIIEALKRFFKDIADKLKSGLKKSQTKSKLDMIESTLAQNPELNQMVEFESMETKNDVYKRYLKDVQAVLAKLKAARTAGDVDEAQEKFSKVEELYAPFFKGTKNFLVKKKALDVAKMVSKEIDSVDTMINGINSSSDAVLKYVRDEISNIEHPQTIGIRVLNLGKRIASSVSDKASTMGKWAIKHPFQTTTAVGLVLSVKGQIHKHNVKMNPKKYGAKDAEPTSKKNGIIPGKVAEVLHSVPYNDIIDDLTIKK